MKRLLSGIIAIASLLLAGCGSMSFGETALDTLTVLSEAGALKECYDRGGTRESCEGSW